ncbi:MAG: hypothetical protein HY738_11845 [Bacteroidia bacterium]|nr:hypothetical protein [Bacteroidia bacterium]
MAFSGTAKFIIDNPGFLTIDSIFPAPNAISGDTIIWNFYNISVLDWWNYTTIYITTATSAQEGDTIHTTLILEPASDDSNPDNNFITEDFIITNSWDPNEKETLPKSDTP